MRGRGEGDTGGTSADQAPPAEAVLGEVARDVADLGVETGLKGVEEAARSGANLLPAILKALEGRATLGEISDRLRAVFGSHRPAALV